MLKLITVFLLIFSLCGCQKTTNDNIITNLTKTIKKSNSYVIKGTLELYNDEENYEYNIDVKYKDDFYYVSLINKNNNKEQLILKNNDGLYVITPDINKSFKFDSNWPKNSSQVYILESLIEDMNSDSVEINSKNNYIKTSVNYPNNSELKYQKIYFDKNKLTKVEVYNNDNKLKIKFTINEYKLKETVDDNIFKLNNYITNTNNETNKTVLSTVDDALYPLYIPNNTYLNSSEIISNEDTSRIILTFSGDNNFVIIEEPCIANEEMETIPVYGNPIFINDTLAALSQNSIYWTTDNINYYLTSKDLTNEELISVASSIGTSTSVIANIK